MGDAGPTGDWGGDGPTSVLRVSESGESGIKPRGDGETGEADHAPCGATGDLCEEALVYCL